MLGLFIHSSMQLTASCGIICSDCAAYKATQSKDMEKLAELAVQWGGDEGLKAEDMLCDGCTSDRVYAHAKKCQVRSSAKEHGVKVCSQCGEYSCDKLEGLWKNFGSDVAKMRSNLEKAK